MLITETHHGLICANSGVDLSNASGDDTRVLLPVDPDASAGRIRAALGPGRAVIVSDTFGRPWLEGLAPEGTGGLGPLLRDPSRDLFR